MLRLWPPLLRLLQPLQPGWAAGRSSLHSNETHLGLHFVGIQDQVLTVVSGAGSRLRRDLMAEGVVAPVASSPATAAAAAARLGGLKELFAFQQGH